MQWVKERLAYAGTSILGINGVVHQNGTGSPSIGHRTPLSGSRAFSRNDSSNSNTSGSQYSGTAGDYNGYPFTPPRTPPPPKTPPPTCRTPTPSTPAKSNGTHGASKESNGGGSYFTFNSPISTRAAGGAGAAVPPTRFAHLKLTPKSSGTGSLGTPVSLNGGSLHNNNITSTTTATSSANSSLRRQRFRQNHNNNSRFESRRRLSKTSSTGTSCGSQEHSLAASTSLLANPIVDRLLDYVRENYVKTMDPFNWDINRKFRLTSFASFRVESGIISGVGNFERLSDSKLTKSLDELTQFVLSSHIVFSDLLAEFRFSARIAKIPLHGKTLRIFLEKAIVYVEIGIDHTMTAKVRMLRLISMDGLECKTRGIAFPLNKSLDSFASKTLHSAASRSDQYVEQCIVPLINRACDHCFESALKSMSITDLFW